MTENMVNVLKRLYRSRPQEVLVAHRTARALQRADLLRVRAQHNKEIGRNTAVNPYHWCLLNEKGEAFCKERFG